MTARIRLASHKDAAAIRRIYAPIVENTAISFETDPPDEAEITERIASTLKRYPWLVCDAGEVVGYAYAGAHRSREAYRWSADCRLRGSQSSAARGCTRPVYPLGRAVRTTGVRQRLRGDRAP